MDFKTIEASLNQPDVQGQIEDETIKKKIIEIISINAKNLAKNNTATSVPDSLLILLNKKAMLVLSEEIMAFIKRNPNLKSRAYTLVSELTSANDLIYASLYQPYQIAELGLPKDLLELLKQDYETKTEIIAKLQTKHLSVAMNDFCLLFRMKEDVYKITWSMLENHMTELKMDDEERRLIVREIWAKQSELRQELTASDFPGKLIEELEAIGSEKLSDLDRNKVENYEKSFDLTKYQMTVFERLIRKSKSFFGSNCKWISRNQKGEAFISKLEQAKKYLVEEEHKTKPANFPNHLKDLAFRDESGAIDNCFTREIFEQIIDLLSSGPTPPFDSDEDMIRKIDDGTALHGLCIGMIDDAKEPVYCRKAPRALFKCPKFVNVREVNDKDRKRSFLFSDESDAKKFKALVFELGLATAETMVNRFASYLGNLVSNHFSSRIIIAMSFFSCSTLSVDFEKQHLKLTRHAQENLENIVDIADAEEFLTYFGSHIPSDSQQLGGIACNTIKITLPHEEIEKITLVEFANKLLERNFVDVKFQQKTSTMEHFYHRASSVEVHCKFEMDNRGPPVSKSELFAETIKYSFSDWHVIELNVANCSIHPVWKWIVKKYPVMKKQAQLLCDSWLQRVKPAEIIDLVAKEFKRTMREIKEQQLEQTNKKITSLLDQFRYYLSSSSLKKSLEDHILFKDLKEFFRLMTTVEALIGEKQESPWVTFVAERDEFLELIACIAQQTVEGAKLIKSVAFLKNAFNDDIFSILENAGCTIKDGIIRLIKVSDEETNKTLAFKELCRQVRIENLATSLKETVKEPRQEHSVLQWKFCLLIAASLRAEGASSPIGTSLQNMLTKRYNWSEGTFKDELKAQAFRKLIEDIEHFTVQKTIKPSTSASSSLPLKGSDDQRTAKNNETPRQRSVQETKDQNTSDQKLDMPNPVFGTLRNSFDLKDPARHERRLGSNRKLKKSFFDFLTDCSPSNSSSPVAYNECGAMNNLKKKLTQCLRNRLSLDLLVSEANNAKIALYDVLLELADDYEPTGLHEIFILLLERRILLPIFNPLTCEHYLALLCEIPYVTDSAKPPVLLGNDTSLYRIVLISGYQPKESQAAELLSSLFHIESFHKMENLEDTLTREALAIDFGIGFLDAPNTGESQYRNQQPVMVVNILGDIEKAAGFIREFPDLLLVEDEMDESQSFHTVVRRKGVDHWIGDHTRVLVWRRSMRGLTLSTEENEKLGFNFVNIQSPLGNMLVKKLGDILRKEADQSNKLRNRKPLSNCNLLGDDSNTYSIEGLVPFDVDAMLKDNLKGVAETRGQLLLQRNFRDQYKYEDLKNEKRLDEKKTAEADALITACYFSRKKDADKVSKIALLKILINFLKNKNPSIRVMALRQLEQGLTVRTEQELQVQQKEVNRLYKLIVGSVAGTSKARLSEEEENKKRYDEAKSKYRDSMLYLEHLWRELSHLYVANPEDYKRLPELAAQHLLDGFSIELLDGDANLMNLQWITAVLSVLNKMLGANNRIFVLSAMGVQSSGKSTLLNTMFGMKMRTSVGQCTRGINMQLLRVEGRGEYDYVLVLDTEGTRSPDFHGVEGNERRDNRMATLSILLADATIVVNPVENDAAVKEILPVVLMAYQGSQLAEENGGRLSSMMFFVYNRIDVRQREKLESIIQALATSLREAFKTVSKLAGRHVSDHNQQTNCLFRHFKLDASNSTESDVRILGQNKKSYEPPGNVPDPSYGGALVEFWEHIHRRVTEPRNDAAWCSRTPLELSDYLFQIWKCIGTADFNLQFAHVLERTAFDLLETEFQAFKHELSSECQKQFGDLRKTMIEMSNSWHQTKNSPNKGDSDNLQSRFLDAISSLISRLDEQVVLTVSAKGCEKWKETYQTNWETYKDQQKSYWLQRIKYAFDNIFLYDAGVEKFKKTMRQEITDSIYKTALLKNNYSEVELEQNFIKMINVYTAKVKSEYPSVDVPEKIRTIYTRSTILKRNHYVDTFDKNLVEFCKQLMDGMEIIPEQTHDGSWLRGKFNKFASFCIEKLNSFFSLRTKKSSPPTGSSISNITSHKAASDLSGCMQRIHEKINESLAGIACYDDNIVYSVIEKIEQILNQHMKDQLEYSHHAVGQTYARIILEASLQKIQWDWEQNNSVPARFSEPSNIEDLRQFFFTVARGANNMKLFGLLVKQKFSDLRKAFEAEMIAETVEITKRQNWLYDFKCTQNYMDTFLVQLIEENSVADLVKYISEQRIFLEEVLKHIILKIAEEQLSTDKSWGRFVNLLKAIIRNSSSDSLNVNTKRAAHYVKVLRNSLLNEFKSEFIAQSFAVDFANEYGELDGEPDDDFKKVCERDVIEEITKQKSPSRDKNFSLRVVEMVIKQLREENAAGAMPRCDACCPWCKSMCILAAGHDPQSAKHDTIHQPAGLAGVGYIGKYTLVPAKCSNYTDATTCWTTKNGRRIEFEWCDWDEIFPDWVKPSNARDWPLREYIFYNYHGDFAKHYRRKPCNDMIETYNRDLNSIKLRLDQDRKGPKIFSFA